MVMKPSNMVLKGVNVTYPEFKLNAISFEVPKGEIVGFVGENGAGKTTTMKAMLNLVSLDEGSITILNQDSVEKSYEIRQDVGVVLDDSFFYETFKISEMDHVMAHIYKNWDSAYFYRLLASQNIDANKRYEECSKGMKVKIKLFIALAHHPDILLLDEPTTGLDPVSREEMLTIFHDYMTDERSILFSSHITSDIDKIADRVIFIHEGNLVLEVTKTELEDNYGLLKLTKQEAEDLGEFDYISKLETRYNVSYLIHNRKEIEREFPDLVLETVTIEEMMLIIKKGEMK